MTTVNKTNTQGRNTMTAFDDIKNDPRSTTEELSSFKRECDENDTMFGALAVGEFVTVTPGSVSNDIADSPSFSTPATTVATSTCTFSAAITS